MGETSMEVGAMPKEYIHARDFDVRYPVIDKNGFATGEMTTDPDMSAARVGWDRDACNVSLVVVDKEKDPDGLDASRWLNLDRHGINRLIRTLRKARDQAYGADA